MTPSPPNSRNTRVITDREVNSLKPKATSHKVGCGDGLVLIVTPEGGKWWRLKYRYAGKERGFSLGTYPEVSLADAREAAKAARRKLVKGTDPRVERLTRKLVQATSFQSIGEEWLEHQSKVLAPRTMSKARWMLTELVYPDIGPRPMSEIQATELLAMLRSIERKGHNETAHRTKQRVSQIFRYAIASGRAARDPTQDLRGALAPIQVENRAAITEPAKVGELLRAIDGHSGRAVTRAALRLAPLVFVRPGELRVAQWTEIDLDTAEWRIPGERMRTGGRHIVPLSNQAVAILRELHRLTGRGKYAFPSLSNSNRPMAENTINRALRRLGYAEDQMTGHGFRAMASTLLNERGFAPDLIELQLAHAERNKTRAAYNRAERLVERQTMMQSWADYLDTLWATKVPSRTREQG
jgi:integrase